jgi:hypothetical protein
MAAPSERWRVLARAGEIEYDRILFFSDAVFAGGFVLRRFEPAEDEPRAPRAGI